LACPFSGAAVTRTFKVPSANSPAISFFGLRGVTFTRIVTRFLLYTDYLRALALLALVTLLLLPQLHRGGLSGYDDALYAHEAREMIDHGDWWTIHFDGAPNFEYPPLFLWLDALSLRILGPSDFAAKLPSALAGIGTVAALYFLAVELTGEAWVGIFSMLVLATTQPFLKYSTHAMTDVPFAFFVTLALLLYLKGLRKPSFLLWAGVAVAAAILTRSAMGALPVAIILLHQRWSALRSRFALGGLLMALGVPLVWAGSQYQLHGAEFLNRHLSFVANKVQGPSFHVWPYLKELLKYYWPWLPVFALGLRKTNSFGLLWTATAIVPLFFIGTAYGRYLMPAFPAMALICGVALHRWIPTARRELYFRGACVVILGAAVYTIVSPSPERGLEMRTLAPAVRAAARPDQRVLLYTGGEQRFDIQNQLLWYGNRYVDFATNLNPNPGAIGVIDKPSFARIAPRAQVLAESEGFVCFRAISSR